MNLLKNNLVQIVGIKEANIEVVEVSTAPDGTAEGTVVEQSPKAGEKVDLTKDACQDFNLQTKNTAVNVIISTSPTWKPRFYYNTKSG